MKKSIIFAAMVAAATAALATGSYTSPTTFKPAVVGTGSNTVSSSAGSSVGLSGAGSATSNATNHQAASAWFGGSGSGTTKPFSGTVTLDNCTTSAVKGNTLAGNVASFGGIAVSGKSTANVTTSGAGATGSARGAGFSGAYVEGSTKLSAGNLNLGAGGSAGGSVETFTPVVTSTGSGSGASQSAGSLGATWNSTQSGSLTNYTGANGLVGDIKNIASNATSYVGGIPTYVPNGCKPGTCVTGPSTATGGALVNGGASAFTNGSVTNTFGTKP